MPSELKIRKEGLKYIFKGNFDGSGIESTCFIKGDTEKESMNLTVKKVKEFFKVNK